MNTPVLGPLPEGGPPTHPALLSRATLITLLQNYKPIEASPSHMPTMWWAHGRCPPHHSLQKAKLSIYGVAWHWWATANSCRARMAPGWAVGGPLPSAPHSRPEPGRKGMGRPDTKGHSKHAAQHRCPQTTSESAQQRYWPTRQLGTQAQRRKSKWLRGLGGARALTPPVTSGDHTPTSPLVHN